MTLLKQKIMEAQSIAILAHKNEDADAIGSMFAFLEVLKTMGKNADCFLSQVPERRLEFLCGDYMLSSDKDYELCIVLDSADIGRISDRVDIFNNASFTIAIDHQKRFTQLKH